ncbi:MAG: carboxypeptidase-like regulatory domain-containing protein [Actinomycetes bacterium]
MRARLTTQQYSAFVGVPFEIIVQVQNDEQIIKEVNARPGFIPTEAYVSRPLVISLFPGETADIQLEITLPRETPAGLYQLPVEMSDENGPIGTLTADIQVAPFDELSVSVSPRVTAAGTKSSFVVTTTNRGNRPTGVSLTAADADRALKFTIEPRRAQLEGGQAVAFSVNAKGKRPFVGNSVPRAIQIDIATRSNTTSETVTFTQKPRLSRGLLTALLLLSIILIWALVFSAGFKSALAGQKPKKAVSAAWIDGAKPDPSISIGSIGAKIVAHSDGRPLARMIVSAELVDKSRPATASSSDEDGAVTISGLTTGTYQLTISGDGYTDQILPDTVRVVPSSEPLALENNIEMVGLPATIKGLTSGGDPNPVSTIEARLMINEVPTGEVTTATSDSTGLFSIENLPSPGRYRLTFTSTGFEPIQLFQEVAAGETVTIPTVKLQAGPGSITGMIVDQSGIPLGGVAITATAGSDVISTVTPTAGSDVGKFILSELRTPATYLIQVVLEGYGTQTLTIQVGPGEPHILTTSITMSKGTGTVRGAVTDSSGNALGGVSVTASNGAIVGQTISVDSGGFYSLTGLVAPGNYILTFSKEGYGTEVIGVALSSSLGAATSNVRLQKSNSSIRGQVTHAPSDEKNGSGATIIATSGLTSLSTVSVDPNGAFQIDGLTSGWWTITINEAGYVEAVVLVQIGITDQELGQIPIKKIVP